MEIPVIDLTSYDPIISRQNPAKFILKVRTVSGDIVKVCCSIRDLDLVLTDRIEPFSCMDGFAYKNEPVRELSLNMEGSYSEVVTEEKDGD